MFADMKKNLITRVGKPIKGIATYIHEHLPSYSLAKHVHDVIFYSIIGFVGDLIDQTIQLKIVSVNANPTLLNCNLFRAMKVGSTGTPCGTIAHICYGIVDSLLPERTRTSALLKTVIIQLSCVLETLIFFTTLALMETSNMNIRAERIAKEILTKSLTLYKWEAIIFLPGNFINFAFIITKYRILFDGCLALLLDTIGSAINYETVTVST